MTTRSDAPRSAAPHVLLVPIAIWLILLALLAMSVISAYIPLGALNGMLNMGIAAIKVGLIAVFFMQLKRASGLVRLAAGAGLFWLTFLFVLSAGDYLTRH